ncbi:hypothetical protein B0H12DRAFT_782091 [Mycena haematopus]|nr:hypothetical protein B0H12DRAFT_782091 [Mycena haematopus]
MNPTMSSLDNPSHEPRFNAKSVPFHPTSRPYLDSISDELLQEIFRLTVRDTEINIPSLTDITGAIPSPILLTHVCKRWKKVALQTERIWTRFSLDLDEDEDEDESYPQTLELLEYFLARASSRGLHFRITAEDAVPPGAMRDIVQKYAARLSSLVLETDESFIDDLLHLPAGSFPSLCSLKLSPLIDDPEKLSHPPRFMSNSRDTAPISHLAPTLSSFAIEPSPYYSCIRQIDPSTLGLNFTKLKELNLSASVPHEMVYGMLSRLCCLRRLTVRMDANTGWEPMGMESDDDEDEEDDGSILAGLARALLNTHEVPRGQKIPRSGFKLEVQNSSAESANTIILPALTNLHLMFSDYSNAATFFERLKLPALASLVLIVEAAHIVYCDKFHSTLMQFLDRSHACLDTLTLYDVRAISGTQAEELSKYCSSGRIRISLSKG